MAGNSQLASEDNDGEYERFDVDQSAIKLLGLKNSSEHSLETERVSESNAPQLKFTSVFAMVVGTIIGSGIFASPSRVDSDVPSPGVALLVWIFAAIIAWAGAASFAELGAAIPKNGGMQEYLRYVYGDLLASIMSWTWIMAVKASAIAILSLIFAEYWTSVITSSASESLWLNKTLAVLTAGTVLLINCISASISIRFTNILMISKLSTVALILIIAVLVVTLGLDNKGEPNQEWKTKNWFVSRPINSNSSSIDWTKMSSWKLLGHLTSALYAALWACGGWDSVNLVAAEMQNPSRDLPRVVHIAVPIVLLCLVSTNLAYYIILPRDVLEASDAIAVAVGRKAFGSIGGIIFAVLVSASCLGVLNIDIYSGGILTETSARHGYLPRFLALSATRDVTQRRIARSPGMLGRLKHLTAGLFVSSHSDIPIKAMIFNVSLSIPYILIGSFGPLVTFVGIAIFIFLFLTVLGSIILRFRQPSLKRPYKPSIVIPAGFCIISFLLVLRGVIFAPIQGAVLAVVIGAGSLVGLFKGR